jgi:chemotaxis protein CheD
MITTQIDASGAVNVILNPGDFHFHCPALGRPAPTRLSTLLGSCVSVVVWHPERGMAGMSHSVLPGRTRRGEALALDGRFCDEAVTMLRKELIRGGVSAQQFHVYLVGGGRMYQTQGEALSIGERNVEAARGLLKQAGFLIRAEHVGMEGYRKLELDLKSGDAVVTFANKRINLRTA